MRISDLQNKKLISEGWNDPQFTLMEQRIIQPWVSSVERYVMEANLSQDQIKNLFTSIEQGADAAGGNRTALGKAKDIAGLPIEAVKWIDNQINKLGSLVQKAGPVKNADAKFEELKKKIGEKDSKVVQAVKAVSDWAKENPGKASVAVGILTAAAAIAGGPLGGAIAGFLARATKDVLQGSKLSTAVGKSMKTAAYGALAGMAFNYISDTITDNIANATDADITAQWDSLDAAAKADALAGVNAEYGGLVDQLNDAQTIKWSGNVNRFYFNYDVIMSPEQLSQLDKFESTLSGMKTFSPEWTEVTAKMHDFMQGVQADPQQDSLKAALEALKAAQEVEADPRVIQQAGLFDKVDNLEAFIQTAEEVNPKIAAAAQGAVTAAEKAEQNSQKASKPEEKQEGEAPAESKKYAGQKLSEGQVYLLFKRLETVNTHMLENKLMFESVFDAVVYYNRQTINEGPMDAIKKGVGKLKQAGKNLTTKVTADKLMKAWNKAGSPTDSDEVYNVIKGLGVADDVIKGTYDSMKIEVPKATDAPDADKDAGAADADTNADAPTDSTAGDAGSDTTDTGAADATAGGDEPAATDDATGDTATSSDPTGTGSATSAKDERYYLQKNTKDETKVDIIDKQTSKPIKNGVALAPEKAEPMSDQMNKEAGKFEPKTGERYTMQPNQQNPKTYDVVDTQTDKPVERGAALQPGDAEEMRDELNSQSTTSTTTSTTQQDGATDANTASTSGGEQPDATTDPQDGETPTADQNTPATADQNAPTDASPAPDNRGAGQGQDTAAPGGPQTAPVDINKLASDLKKLSPEQIEDAKKLLAA